MAGRATRTSSYNLNFRKCFLKPVISRRRKAPHPTHLGLIRGRLNGQLRVRTKSSRSSWVDPADITDKPLSAMLQKNAPATDGNAESRPPLYFKRLLDMDNQIGDDAALVKALRWAVVRQSEDALAAASPRLLLLYGSENE
jgi:hypothetical protein